MMKDIMIQLLLEQPYFGYIGAKVSFEEDDSIVTTQMRYDNKPIIAYNRDWFESLDEKKKKGHVIHELLHLGLLHPYRREHRRKDLWLAACDIAVNEFIESDQQSSDSLTRYAIFRELKVEMDANKSAEYYYNRLLDEEDQISFEEKEKKRLMSFPSQRSYRIESFEDIDQRQLGAKALMEELISVQSLSMEEGVIKGPLGDLSEEIYREHKQDWRHILKLFLSGQGRIRRTKTYKRQSRRFEDVPGWRRSLGMKALVAIDESGSVSNADVASFHKELSRIRQIAGTDIQVTRFDTECSEPVSLREFLTDKQRRRKGGTDFRPIFELADREKIPVVIIFTDGQGKAPMSVHQKVLWVLLGQQKAPVNYGTEVHFHEN